MQEQRKYKSVNLLVTIDRKYLTPLVNMLDSYKKVHEDIETNVYIAHSSLSDDEIYHIKENVGSNFIHIHSIRIEEKWFSETPVLERLPEESFYRLMAFHYLPKEVTRCIYLDPDIYIKKSLLPLYAMPIDGYYIAAASHLYGFHNQINKWRLGLEKQKRYVNSGVMLMNLEEIRNTFTIHKILDCLSENVHKLLLGDQDLINILFDGKILLIDECIYNLDEHTLKHNRKKVDQSFINNEAAIIHYNGKYKPWLHGYKGVLDAYYPYQDEKGPAPVGKWKAQTKAIGSIIGSSVKLKVSLISSAIIVLLILL